MSSISSALSSNIALEQAGYRNTDYRNYDSRSDRSYGSNDTYGGRGTRGRGEVPVSIVNNYVSEWRPSYEFNGELVDTGRYITNVGRKAIDSAATTGANWLVTYGLSRWLG